MYCVVRALFYDLPKAISSCTIAILLGSCPVIPFCFILAIVAIKLVGLPINVYKTYKDTNMFEKVNPVSSICKENEFRCNDTMLEDMVEHTNGELLGKEETKQNIKKKSDCYKVISQLEQRQEKEKKFLEVDLPKQDLNLVQQIEQFPKSVKEMKQMTKLSSNTNILLSKFLKVNIERLPQNTILELSRQDEKNMISSDLQVNAEKEESISSFPSKQSLPLFWTTNRPPRSPSPPPPSWYSSTHLWQLDATEFGSMSGLCTNEIAAEIRRRVDAPKSSVRVLRRRSKKKV